jgi:hypothetical protein
VNRGEPLPDSDAALPVPGEPPSAADEPLASPDEPLLTPAEVIEVLGPEGLERAGRGRWRPIDHLFGLAVFLLILVTAGVVGTGVTAASLLGREEQARQAWERVMVQEQRREALVAESLRLLGDPVERSRAGRAWSRAQVEAAGARTPAEEVAAARSLESAFHELFSLLKRSAATGPPEAGPLIERMEGTVLLLEVERGRYDRAVMRYREMSAGVPGRWVARLFGLRPLEPWTPAEPAAEPAAGSPPTGSA